VWGIPHVQAGTINVPIGRSQRDRTAMCVTNNGRPSETQWECAEIFPKANQTLLICRPLTGRTHQIRVHLKHIGHPIVGDEKYGKPDARLFLHAMEITFQHPISQKQLTFRAPLPENFQNKLNQLRTTGR
jgi:23S rRNA pseudouridine1911/1915/1917 synthase